MSAATCRRCGRPLSNPLHRDAGIGPICARKAGVSLTAAAVAGVNTREPRSTYQIERVTASAVFLRDLDCGRSVTNDAERVVAEIVAEYPGRRIYYFDSIGLCDELRHNGCTFTGFAPAREINMAAA